MPEPIAPYDPSRCLLDQNRLANIEKTATNIDQKLDHLLSHEGPISQIRERLAVVEGATASSHTRIDHLETVFEKQDVSMNALAVKVAAISAILTSGSVLAIIKVFG